MKNFIDLKETKKYIKKNGLQNWLRKDNSFRLLCEDYENKKIGIIIYNYVMILIERLQDLDVIDNNTFIKFVGENGAMLFYCYSSFNDIVEDIVKDINN